MPTATGGAVGDDHPAAFGEPCRGGGHVGIDRGGAVAFGVEVEPQQLGAAVGIQVDRGGPGRDRLFGGIRADVLLAGRGDDVVRGRGGADHLYGGAGDDVMIAGPGSDHAFGQAGDDQIYGRTGSDRLQGGPGEDNLIDFSGHDVLFGGRGADYLNTFEIVPDGQSGDYLNARAGPDYGCRATPDDTLVGCDEAAK